MSRTNLVDVKVILPSTTLLTDPQITAAIEAATLMVDRIAASCASDLSVAALTSVEKYLAAHFAAVTENTLSISSESDSCGGGQIKYGFMFGEGVKGTPFGITANMMSGGCLAEYDKQPVGMFSIGSL